MLKCTNGTCLVMLTMEINEIENLKKVYLSLHPHEISSDQKH